MKLFVCSDIHGFAQPLIDSLEDAGFDKSNKNHLLIVIGDIFDRGSQAVKVYKYLHSIPKDRRIMIRGNHESLLLELLEKKFPEDHDFSNCTVGTVCQLANDMTKKKDPKFFADESYLEGVANTLTKKDLDKIVKPLKDWEQIKNIAKEHPAVKWLKSDEWINYYEYDKYIFVHSFIPLINKDNLPIHYVNNRLFEYMPDWRTKATSKNWYEASWGCPWKLFLAGLFDEENKKGKVLVCGHWHTSDFFRALKNNYGYEGEIYFSKELIAIDGGVKRVLSPLTLEYEYYHLQNVLVIDEDGKCYDELGRELKEIRRVPIIETVCDIDKEK